MVMRNPFRNLLLQTAVLVMFVLSGSGLLPCLLGGLAKLDGGHRVGVTQTGGATVIVLGHEPDAGPVERIASRHQHSLLADVVLSFSAGRGGETDHLIAISSSEFSRQIDSSRPTPAAVTVSVCRALRPVLSATIVGRPAGSPRRAANTVQLRTVVMLV